jgi:hypothetical protein
MQGAAFKSNAWQIINVRVGRRIALGGGVFSNEGIGTADIYANEYPANYDRAMKERTFGHILMLTKNSVASDEHGSSRKRARECAPKSGRMSDHFSPISEIPTRTQAVACDGAAGHLIRAQQGKPNSPACTGQSIPDETRESAGQSRIQYDVIENKAARDGPGTELHLTLSGRKAYTYIPIEKAGFRRRGRLNDLRAAGCGNKLRSERVGIPSESAGLRN